MSYIGYALVLLLSVVGFVECLQQLARTLHQKRHPNQSMVIVPAKGTPKQLEFLLRELQREREWGSKTPHEIYVVDLGLSREGKQMLQLLQRDMIGVSVCTESELSGLLKQQLA